MAYEFKKLSEVDVVESPSDAANVLIEENGVIKKAPKTAVGGAGGGNEYDLVLYGVENTNLYIMSGSAEVVVNKLMNINVTNSTSFDPPKVIIYGTLEVGYCVNVKEIFLTPEPAVQFPKISVPGATDIIFGIADVGNGWTPYMSVGGEDYIWAEEYNG